MVNREYSNLSYHFKKLNEKKARRQAKLYALMEENIEGEMEQTGNNNIERQLHVRQEIESLEAEEQEILVRIIRQIPLRLD